VRRTRRAVLLGLKLDGSAWRVAAAVFGWLVMKYVLFVFVVVLVLVASYAAYSVWVANPRVERELRGAGANVRLLIAGESLEGHARAIEDDPELRVAVFDRLRPTAPKLFGTLVHIDLVPVH
jgi:hypothetical protein